METENKPDFVKANIEQMTSSRSGKNIPNQFIIRTDKGVYFQSYDSVIALKTFGENHKVYLDADKWDYSRTTGKYRNDFLRETKKETEAKIKSGEYILTNLN